MRSHAALAFVLFSLTLCNAKAADEGKVYVDFQEVAVPMRDGVHLQTVIISPKARRKTLPIVLRRTPYGVPNREGVDKGLPAALRPVIESQIFVIQNLRGQFKSEGKFVMQRPPHAADDPKGVDETTDAWDTVEWLVHNVAGNNGRVGLEGTSYDAWTAVMAALDPHPAVKAIVEQASPADMFLGDDFHHNGAFRLSYGFEYSALLETTAEENFHFKFDRADTYEWYLNLGVLRNAESRYFHGTIPTWRDFVEHPNYDEFWRRQTVISYITDVKVPILHVAGWWDQEDFYGPQKIYAAMEKYDRKGLNYFVAGPWNHGQWNGEASQLGPISFGSDTAKYYKDKIRDAWFAYWLRDEGSLRLAEATTFETGTNRWRQYDAWPLTANLRVAGDITAQLFAATSGTHSDWVVKLIDVYPEDAPDDEKTKTPMGGYELIIADEILRGRFRNSFERPQPIEPNKPIDYRIDLHTNDHAFLKGHRIMVQVQSSWFPAYDRNPQEFVSNIFKAGASEYRKATQKIYHTAGLPSSVLLPVIDEP